MTRPNPFSIYPLRPSSKPSEPPKASGTGQALRELQAASAAEKRELMSALRRQATPGAMGVYAAEELLSWLKGSFPCLSYGQRVDLVSGHGTRSASAIEAIEIAETLTAWWCRSDDPDEINRRVELVVAQGGLPSSSRELLSRVRTQVNNWRLDQRLPRLREITQTWDQLKRWAAANEEELDLEQSAEVVAERTNALAELHRELHADEPLVFGLVEAHEARLWLLCCDWVMEGETGLDPKKTPMQKLERKAAELLDKCLRLGVNHPDQIEAEMKIRRGIWDGYRGGIVQDSRGRWFYGDGTPAIPQQGGGFKRQRSGLGGMFEGVDRDAIWSEIGRCFALEKERSKQSDATQDSKD